MEYPTHSASAPLFGNIRPESAGKIMMDYEAQVWREEARELRASNAALLADLDKQRTLNTQLLAENNVLADEVEHLQALLLSSPTDLDEVEDVRRSAQPGRSSSDSDAG